MLLVCLELCASVHIVRTMIRQDFMVKQPALARIRGKSFKHDKTVCIIER